jgi:transcription elongation factor Elf1
MDFKLEEVKSSKTIMPIFDSCNCCGQKTNVTYQVKTWEGEEYFVCVRCGRTIQYYLTTYKHERRVKL